MTRSAKEIINKFIKAYNSFSIEEMLSFLHPQIHFVNISNGVINAESKGKNEFEKLARQSAALFKEREQRIISFKEISGGLEIEIEYRAVPAADLPNGIKKGEVLNLRGKSEYNFRDNLIISIRDIS